MFAKLFGKKEKGSAEREGIDLSMRYCPSCATEYRPETASCAHCNIPLLSGEAWLAQKQEKSVQLRQRSMVLDPADQLVPLRQGTLQEMKAIQHLLKKERIPSILSGDEMSCRGCRPQLTVEIKETDLAAAEEILAADFLASTGVTPEELAAAEVVFDIQAEEVVCPACHARFSPSVGACPECGLSFM